MQLISCHGGKLLTLSAPGEDGAALPARKQDGLVTGLPALDALAPGGALARGVVHELLADPSDGSPLFTAMLLAKSITEGKAVVWCDPRREIYPPALAAHGVSLDRLFLLRPGSNAEQTWAIAECLRCKGVGAVVAPVGYSLSRVEARRLQLSAERGGGVGLLLRPLGRASAEHAAATRWLVRPAPGERTVQRWSIQLVHGHGGRVGQSVILEYSRETNRLRAVEQLADRAGEKEAAGRGAPRRVPA
jgi:protein ImuA